MANTILPGYVQYVGEKYELIVEHGGPASYVNTGTFSTSGELLNAADLGIGGFEFISGESLSNDGTYFPRIQLLSGGAKAQARIHWYVTSTGAEVANAVNLSASTIRLYIRAV